MSSLIVGGLLAAVYLAINLLLPVVPLDTLVVTYVLQPLLWCLLILAVRLLPGYRTAARQSLWRTFILIGLGIGFLQIFFYFTGGLFSGFGKNSSALAPLGILENLFFVGTMLVGMELSRAWLLARFGKRRTFLVLTLVTLGFTFISIPLNQVTGFPLQVQSISLVISAWVPLLAENLVASFLALLGGARASLAYRGLLAAFWWFCPVLPNLSWSFKGLIGAIVPILGIIAISGLYSTQVNRGKSRQRGRKAAFPTSWILTAVACVIIIWFSLGMFPIQPSVIPTGSMIPAVYPGDVILVAKTPASSIKLGDIIEFRNVKDNINVVHRVSEIQKEGSQRFFITKGDNNNDPDPDPVAEQHLIGKVIIDIPRVGWISLFIKNLFSSGP